jgi:hypothetical protein
MIKLDVKNVFGFVPESEIMGLRTEAVNQLEKLKNGSGKGNDFLGWLNLPSSITEEELNKIEKCAERLKYPVGDPGRNRNRRLLPGSKSSERCPLRQLRNDEGEKKKPGNDLRRSPNQ